MKALDKKLTGIYVPGYLHAGNKKFDSSADDLILDVLDTDEDRIMYRYTSAMYNSKSRSASKQHAKNEKN